MQDLTSPDHPERDLIRRWHLAHVKRTEAVPPLNEGWRSRNITPRAAEGLELLEQFRLTRDLGKFQSASDL